MNPPEMLRYGLWGPSHDAASNCRVHRRLSPHMARKYLCIKKHGGTPSLPQLVTCVYEVKEHWQLPPHLPKQPPPTLGRDASGEDRCATTED